MDGKVPTRRSTVKPTPWGRGSLVGGNRSAKRALGEPSQDLQRAWLRISGGGLAREDARSPSIRGRERDDLIDQRRGRLLVELQVQRGKALHRRDGVKTEDRAVLRKLIAGTLGRA